MRVIARSELSECKIGIPAWDVREPSRARCLRLRRPSGAASNNMMLWCACAQNVHWPLQSQWAHPQRSSRLGPRERVNWGDDRLSRCGLMPALFPILEASPSRTSTRSPSLADLKSFAVLRHPPLSCVAAGLLRIRTFAQAKMWMTEISSTNSSASHDGRSHFTPPRRPATAALSLIALVPFPRLEVAGIAQATLHWSGRAVQPPTLVHLSVARQAVRGNRTCQMFPGQQGF